MHDPFDRRISNVGVSLVKGRLRQSNVAWNSIKEGLDFLLRSNDCFHDAPFLYVLSIYRYGIKNDLKVEFQKIGKQYGDLGVALELDFNILKWADQHNLALLKDIFMIAALEALLQVCDKYKLPKEAIVVEREKHGDIPNTIKECESY